MLLIENLRQKALELNYVNIDLKNIGERYICELFHIKTQEKELEKEENNTLKLRKKEELEKQKKTFTKLEALFNQAVNNSSKIQQEYEKLLEDFISKLDSESNDSIQELNAFILKSMFDLCNSEKIDVSFSKDNTLMNFYKNLLSIINNRKKQILDYKDE